jgi:transcriptional antiterminator RfaH
VQTPEINKQLCWYAVRTKPRQENRAESNLMAWEVETYLPRVVERRRRAFGDRPSTVIKPLFSRYLFCKFKLDDLHKVYYTRGIDSVVSYGKWPTPVDEEIIAFLKSQSDASGYIRIGEELEIGNRVQIVSGPLKDFVGILEGKFSGRERVSILLTAVSFQNRVLIEQHMIKKIA